MESVGKIFENIYAKNQWGNGSGPGSFIQFNIPFLDYISRFLIDKHIKSIVDVGCGDFQVFKTFNFELTQYIGLDVVNSVVQNNNSQFSKPNVKFALMPAELGNLPEADLYILKDLLIHLDNVTAVKLVRAVISRCGHAIFVNNISDDQKQYNKIIQTGEFRPVDVTLEPFSLEVIHRFVYGNSWEYDPRMTKFIAMLLRKKVWPGQKHLQLVRGARRL